MRLKTRFIVILASFVLALVALATIVAQTVLAEIAARMDEDILRQTISRGIRFAGKQQDYLRRLTMDWAFWDDAYTFAGDLNPEFVEANLVESTFTTLRLSLVAFFDSEGNNLAAYAYDLDKEEFQEPHPRLLSHFRNCPDLAGRISSSESTSGFILLGDEKWMIACSPVLRSNKDGPARGFMVMGRQLGDSDKRDLADIVYELATLIPEEDQPDNNDPLGLFVDRLTLVGRASLPRLCEHTGLALEVRMPRHTMAQNLVSGLYLPGWILLSSSAIMVFVFWLLHIWVLRDLSASVQVIRSGVAAVAQDGNVDMRLPRQRPGEMGELADAINQMLETLQSSQQRLRASENLYRSLVEAAPFGIVSLDLDGCIRSSNARFLSMMGVDSVDSLKCQLLSTAWPVQLAKEIQGRVATLEPGESAMIEDRPCRQQEETRWFSAAITRAGNGDDAFVLLILIDTTERVAAQEEAEKRRTEAAHAQRLAALGTMVAGVAHEVNNPNGAINLNLSVLERLAKEGGAEGEALQKMQAIIGETRDASNRIAHLISSLKSFSRPLSSAPDDHVDINSVIRRACSWIRHEVEQRDCKLMIDLAEDLPPISGSPQQLEQVFLNLLQNASLATSGKDSFVSISSRYDNMRHCIVIACEDNGEGIDRETLSHIFEPFFTTRRESGGTGLGLSISLSIVLAHGGQLRVESDGCSGAVATVTLPASREKRDA